MNPIAGSPAADPIAPHPAFIGRYFGQTAQRAVAVSLVDAQQCIHAERKSVNFCFVHAPVFVIAALCFSVGLLCLSNVLCLAFNVCCAFWVALR